MKRNRVVLSVLIFFAVWLCFSIGMKTSVAEEAGWKPLIYDEAGLLNQDEIDELNELANQMGALRETDIIIWTSDNPENIDVELMTEDFYDEQAPGYDKPHGNAVILTLDMNNREVYLAGFYKAETYLDNDRLDEIRSQITPDLANGDYKLAFQTYIETAGAYLEVLPEVKPDITYNSNNSYNNDYSPPVQSPTHATDQYVTSRPEVNREPDNLFLNTWFQLAVSLIIGVISVAVMAYRSGGRVTVNSRTYEEAHTSGILDSRDDYLHTTVTKQKIERNTNNGSGGGSSSGGGMTSGGHSHSSSRGSF
ncbi:TPM domain-containing protein [Brevibacillus sp. AY1]|uniref:TPM domain-containing protein n=1 Tax=Brevibacillus sp. AY1 TaxID=2807621 RepID=UPI002456EC53|nr:TPM domain-containing protein [Brevibacillus sp. AY1]MDH4616998.1 TPM domain-containing protein [Brevibacillus sp. AY1]